ncbi:hypothetical protein NADFUDRAFT_83685 [Nadsonia fulvescens var. elongata DSM 6958]|uniref:Anaphase-promoting complex subunit 2 n=1 Tax=Nadsonia fulvescens var. elongata DSM 6958 TaxID=857566 RepID=A0A1E3PHN9_9ASCO|nr:hypothetical protein NADFUDRAFT_83685 [Nadsonia fulvescens var. elongata DSM 6958]
MTAVNRSIFDSVFSSSDLLFDDVEGYLPAVDTVAALEILKRWMAPKDQLYAPTDDVLRAAEYLRFFEDQLMAWYTDEFRLHFNKYAVPMLYVNERHADQQENARYIAQISNTLHDAHKHYFHPLTYLELSDDITDCFQRSFNALVCYSLPTPFFYRSLKDYFRCFPIISDYTTSIPICEGFYVAGLRDTVERALAETAVVEMEIHIKEQYTAEWALSVLEHFESWLTHHLTASLEALLGRKSQFRADLLAIGLGLLGNLRTNELFDIVVDYPDSTPALDDIKRCLRTPTERAKVVNSFQIACVKRLLHPGANTVDIVVAYLNTIRAFMILDPRGVLLAKISRPIRRYLKEREDTVGVIVAGMLGTDDTDLKVLHEELSQHGNKYAQNSHGEVDDLKDLNWCPDPIDAPLDFKHVGRANDMIGSLLSLYENKDVFVREFVVIFANRLLESEDYNIDQAVIHLELLKLRFGEQELLNLDIMIRDIAESKRVNSSLHGKSMEINTSSSSRPSTLWGGFNAKILSRLFWPNFNDVPFLIPQIIKDQADKYSQGFEKLKQGRKLRWLNHIGSVKVELELEDRSLDFVVTPEQASVIELFQHQPRLSLLEVTNQLQAKSDLALRAIRFWVSKGVLKDHGTQEDVFIVLERAEEKTNVNGGVVESFSSAAIQSTEEASSEEMRVYWSYIVGMLTNLGSMPLDRIQSFLRMLVPQDNPYTRSQDELQLFLDLMVEEEQLEVSGDGYRLKK